ncbi:hypothetical protein BD310DRAFT_1040678 [Dichomitus squalens]|uniref:Mug135-like C-terminal domain-containing protein n=1 Tax=Dichomitus squalens TaxID=114155 RepID=A0A4Q9PPA6_9APHY|nr:hypothetical protein BD310DRAFT_1040678 [Dichomitus squalens]
MPRIMEPVSFSDFDDEVLRPPPNAAEFLAAADARTAPAEAARAGAGAGVVAEEVADGRMAARLRDYLTQFEERLGKRFTHLEELIDQRCTAIDQRLAGIDQRLAGTDQCLDVLVPLAAHSTILMAKTENQFHRDPDDLEEVPFPNGLLPWGKTVEGSASQGSVRAEVELPALSSVGAVHALDTPQTYGYFRGYYPNDSVPSVSSCKKLILLAIGRPLDAQ